MLKSLSVRGGSEADTRDTLRLYADALRDIPLEKVAPVLRAFRIGDLGDGKWAPRPGEIRRAVYARADRATSLERQTANVNETLAARRAAAARAPKSQAEIARAIKLVADLKAELAATSAADPVR